MGRKIFLFLIGGVFVLAGFVSIVKPAMAFSGSGSGTEEDPYVITTVEQLQEMKDNLTAYYELGNDIDASATSGWNDGAGFEPIGTENAPFTGSLDGQGYKIENLFINRATNYIGLFGYVGSGGVVKNVGLENVNVTGSVVVGGLVGRNWGGTVSNCYSTGFVSGNNYVGGLVGYNWGGTVSNSYSTGEVSGEEYVGGLVGRNRGGTVSNCYSTGFVSGNNCVGGLVGYNWGGTVSNSYSTGAVTGSSYVGGLVGYNDAGTVSNSFWDTQTSGQATSAGGTGKTTVEMMTLSTFGDAGWDIVLIQNYVDQTWYIDEGNDYPKLGWQLTTPTVTTTAVSSITTTTAESGGNVTNDGGASVTARGVCWSTSENPTISDSKTTDGTGTGEFTSSITGLSPGTTYYVRAYATNSAGTGYGEQRSFTTTPTYTITATAGSNGSISPSGVVTVNHGDNKTFTITANANYYILDVKVDTLSQGAISFYTFTNVTSNHTIHASFSALLSSAWVDSTTGNDANPGTDAEPFATIQKGVNMSASGATIYVAAGTYTENVTVNTSMTISGAGSETTILDANGGVGWTINAEGVTISGFTITGADTGILLDADNASIYNNTIQNNNHGLYITGDNNYIIGNNLLNNTDSGVYLSSSASGNIINFNNIVGNSSYGVYNDATEIANAENNWWGNNSGPTHSSNPEGTGDTISDDVDYDPWLKTEVGGGITQEIPANTTETIEDGDLGVAIDITTNENGSARVIITSYTDNPVPEIGFVSGFEGVYYDVYVINPEYISQIKLRIYYSVLLNLTTSDKPVYWYDGSNWVLCSDQLVVPGEVTLETTTYGGYVEITINNSTSPTLSDLSGTPFAIGFSAGEETPTTGLTSATGGGCFIATAAYGTPMAEEVEALRRFRDNVLMKTVAGKEFIKLYYATSPPIADLIRSKPLLRALVRTGLEPLIWFTELRRKGE